MQRLAAEEELEDAGFLKLPDAQGEVRQPHVNQRQVQLLVVRLGERRDAKEKDDHAEDAQRKAQVNLVAPVLDEPVEDFRPVAYVHLVQLAPAVFYQRVKLQAEGSVLRYGQVHDVIYGAEALEP